MKIICSRNFLLLIFAAFIFFALTSCGKPDKLLLDQKDASGSRIPPDTLVSIDEFSPLGQCFTIVISADGNAVYTPTRYMGYDEPKVPQQIPIKTKLSQEQLEQIILEFENQNFFSLNDEYVQGKNGCPGGVLDAGGERVSIVVGGRKKSVNWGGCIKNTEYFPPQFFAVVGKINENVNAK